MYRQFSMRFAQLVSTMDSDTELDLNTASSPQSNLSRIVTWVKELTKAISNYADQITATQEKTESWMITKET